MCGPCHTVVVRTNARERCVPPFFSAKKTIWFLVELTRHEENLVVIARDLSKVAPHAQQDWSGRRLLRGVNEIVTGRPSGAKEHRSCAPADAVPRDLHGEMQPGTLHIPVKTACEKLSPSTRSMFLELFQQSLSSRAPPSWRSRPSRAPARSATSCHG